MMVKYSEDLTREFGYEEIVLHARETAVPFYEPLGYTRVGDRFTEVTIPHWVMVRALHPNPRLQRTDLRPPLSRQPSGRRGARLA